MSLGIHFNRKHIYENMWDFLRDLNDTMTYQEIVELSELHFSLDSAIMYPMAWSICKLYGKQKYRDILNRCILQWFETMKKV